MTGVRMVVVPLLLLAVACDHQDGPRFPTIVGPVPSGPIPPNPSPPKPNGTLTMTSIASQRTCSDQLNEFRRSRQIWFILQGDELSVTLSIALSAPPYDPQGDLGPVIYKGTRTGDSISASQSQLYAVLICSANGSTLPQMKGDLNAQVAGGEISGDIVEIYGSGSDEVTITWHFQATVQAGSPPSR
jgi:hypothetical protein